MANIILLRFNHFRSYDREMKTIFSFFVSVVCAGCIATRTAQEFVDEVSCDDSLTLNSVWYLGTKEDGDYFRHQTMFSKRTVRVCPRIVPEHARLPYPVKEGEWILVKPNWGTACLDLVFFFRYGKTVPIEFFQPEKILSEYSCPILPIKVESMKSKWQPVVLQQTNGIEDVRSLKNESNNGVSSLEIKGVK